MKKFFLVIIFLFGCLLYSQAQIKIFVVRANGNDKLHFPQYALDQGANLSKIELHPNKKGSNFKVEVTENIVGDYGVYRENGKLVFYVKDAFLSEYLDVYQVDIKYEGTQWRPEKMIKIGGFWIYRE
jgi:hypothetical protein